MGTKIKKRKPRKEQRDVLRNLPLAELIAQAMTMQFKKDQHEKTKTA